MTRENEDSKKGKKRKECFDEKNTIKQMTILWTQFEEVNQKISQKEERFKRYRDRVKDNNQNRSF